MVALTNIPYMGVVGIFVLLIIGLSYTRKKLEKLNFLGFTEEDKRILMLLVILIVIFDALSTFPNTCTDYIPKLPVLLLILILLFILVVGFARGKEKGRANGEND